MNLTPHFTLEELIHSDLATRRGIDNNPPSDVLPNLVRLAQVLEQVRMLLIGPILISSGYRCPAVNRAVGGSAVSAHCEGRAADFICPEYGTPREVAERLARSTITYDQVIFEGTWVHIGIPRREAKPRLQTLTAHFGAGPATYTEGIG